MASPPQDLPFQMRRLEQMVALGELASGLAHDFNNALATILGHTQLLLMHSREPAFRRRLETIERTARDACAIVQRLRRFYHPEPAENLAALDVNWLVQEVAQITQPKWQHEAENQGRQINMILAMGEVKAAWGRAAELREVLINLILNALWAMPRGGTLTLETTMDAGQVVIRVRDTGIGMSEETRRQAFEPFFTTKGDQGTGLGLSVAQKLIREMGGEIEVDSAEGQGAAFTLRLPTAPPGAAPTPDRV
jgi:signal transduction histidine kinase